MKSRLCLTIDNYNLKNKHYKSDILKAEKAVDKGEILYAFSPKKDEIVVAFNNSVYVRLFMFGSLLKSECNCKNYYQCPHVLAAIIFCKRHIEKLDNICGSDEGTNLDNSLLEIYLTCKRIVGWQKVLIKHYVNDFNNNIILLENFQKYEKTVQNAKVLIKLISLLDTITDEYSSKVNKSEEIIFLMNCLLTFDEKVFKEIINEINYTNNSNNPTNLNDEDVITLCQTLSNNSSVYDDEEKFATFQDVFLEFVKNTNNETKKKMSIYPIIRMKASKLLSVSFASYYDFIKEYITSSSMLLDVITELYNRDLYNEVIHIFENHQDIITDYHAISCLEKYLKSHKKLNTITKKVIDDIVDKFNEYNIFKLFSDLGLLDYFDDILLTLKSQNYDSEKIIEILNDIEKSDLLFLECKKKGIKKVSEYIKTITKENNFDVIEYYQEEILKLFHNKSAYTPLINEYLKDFEYFEYGEFYLYHLLNKIIELYGELPEVLYSSLRKIRSLFS